jgi:two-component sensor histidine kinase
MEATNVSESDSGTFGSRRRAPVSRSKLTLLSYNMESDMTDAMTLKSPEHCDRLMLNEMTHRVNNEFAGAIGVVAAAAAVAGATVVGDMLTRVQRQLANAARIHHLLTPPQRPEPTDAAAFVRALCEAVHLSRLQTRGIELQFIGHPLQLDAECAWRLGVVVYELVVNAAKHAFGEGAGRITVEIARRDGIVHARVEDSGGGKSGTGHGRGLGLVDAFAKELQGRIHQRLSVKGSVAMLVFPAFEYPSAASPELAAEGPDCGSLQEGVPPDLI